MWIVGPKTPLSEKDNDHDLGVGELNKLAFRPPNEITGLSQPEHGLSESPFLKCV